jgi:hypothetical protein
MRSYDYANREGVRHFSWEDAAVLSRALTETLADEQVEIVIGTVK